MTSNNIKRISFITIVTIAMLMTACNENASPVASATDENPDISLAKGKIVNFVSAGSNDACEAFGLEKGCDGNFSLVATESADGTVSGQYQDTFSGGGEGVHAKIDCFHVIGNGAVVSGIVTKGGSLYDVGSRVITAVVDNGTSANDSPDQISFTFAVPPDFNCEDFVPGDFPLNDLTTGQVTVK